MPVAQAVSNDDGADDTAHHGTDGHYKHHYKLRLNVMVMLMNTMALTRPALVTPVLARKLWQQSPHTRLQTTQRSRAFFSAW